jgi:hypothetical protein
MASWIFKQRDNWARLDKQFNINNKYLPCSAFEYRFDFQYAIYNPTGGGEFNAEHGKITFIVWIETPECRDPSVLNTPAAILLSPFVQKVEIPFTIAYLDMLFTWWFSTEIITDQPPEAGFTETTKYPRYPSTQAEIGFEDPASGSDYGIGDPMGYIISQYQSCGYAIKIPKDSRFRILKNTAQFGSISRAAVISLNFITDVAGRVSIAKGRDRLLYRTDAIDDQIVLRRSIPDYAAPVNLTATTGDKKSNPVVNVNSENDIPIVYDNTDGICVASSGDKGDSIQW